MSDRKITCLYCTATNDLGANECAKCGAPLRYDVRTDSPASIIREALLSLSVATDYPVNGCDISQHNGLVNWDVLAGKVDFAFIRFSYGNKGLDLQAERNVQMAVDHGRPYGGYHYMSPALDWRKNAANFSALVNSLGGGMPPLGDLEETGGLNKTDLESWAYKFWNEVEQQTGREMACYTSPGFLNTAMGLTNWLKTKKLCVAHWTNAGSPTLPREWSVPGKTWEWWQWKVYRPGSDYGTQNAAIDLQRFNGNRAQFESRYGQIGGSTPPPPDPEPEPNGCLKMQVVQDGLRIRRGPGTHYDQIGSLSTGQIVDVLNVGGQDCWVEIAPGEWANVQQGADVNMRKV